MVAKATRLLIAEEVIQDGLHRLADARNRFTWATMGYQAAHVLQEEGGRLLDPDDFLYVEKERAAGIGKSLLMTRLAKRLTREASTKDIKSRDAGLRIHLSDIPLEVFVVVGEQGLIGTMVEVVPVSLTGGWIPLARKDTLGSLSIVESDVESSDSGEKIDKLVDGLLGHAPPKHILAKFKSHKWTPVHPGESATLPPHPRRIRLQPTGQPAKC